MREVQTILLVDDDEDIRTVAAISLSRVGGWEVLSARSGVEALELAATGRPDLILLDVMMPDLDGPATLARLKDHPETTEIPVVFLTARVQKQELARYVELGAIGVIAKPFDPMQLPRQILEIVAQG